MSSVPDHPPAPSALPARHWYAERVLALVMVILMGFVGVTLLASVALRPFAHLPADDLQLLRIAASQLSLQLPVLVGLQWFLRAHQIDWRRGFGVQWSLRIGLAGVATGLAGVLVGYPLQAAGAWLLRALGREPQAQEAVLAIARAGWGGRCGIAVLAILGAAVAEEALFRGIFFPVIRDSGRPRLALWAVSLLFGAIHFNLAAFVPLTLFGAALSVLYLRTGNLLAPIIAHATFNLVGFVAAITAWEPFGPG